MEVKTAKPDKQYLENARLLKGLLKGRWPEGQEALMRLKEKERRRLQNLLREMFASAFELQRLGRKLREKFSVLLRSTACGPRAALLDHEDYFQRGENLVVVSQPYELDKSELTRWAAECGAFYSILDDEWRYYSPEDASLFLIEFTPGAIAELEKRLGSPGNAA
jgi:hypothetical protein